MSKLHSVAFLGNYAPRCCGIATFTQDLRAAVGQSRPEWQKPVAMVSDDPEGYAYPEEVRWVLAEKDRPDYVRLARDINASSVQAVSLQHEYGIYGGDCGGWLLDLLGELKKPVITTCHTILKDPLPLQKEVMVKIAEASSRIVVMAEKGREFLLEAYGVPDQKIRVIHHGIPEVEGSASERLEIRQRYRWARRPVILTFGLLSPNKGVEHMIRALPALVRSHPDVLYVVVGATHPNLLRAHGDLYRDGLKSLITELGMENHVQLVDRFVTREELVAFIDAADIYTTPYLNEAQITSGTLAYAFGLGKPVISTPYWYAEEMLANGAGILVPFRDEAALAEAARDLLSDEGRRLEIARMARAKGRGMSWPAVGLQYANLLEQGVAQHTFASHQSFAVASVPPQPVLAYLFHISGDFGVHQHARGTTPAGEHGFCTDDNARAAILLADLPRAEPLPQSGQARALYGTCIDMVQRALYPPTGRFRNFLDSDGHWLEEQGSEDSHGRALWALGHCASHVGEGRDRCVAAFRSGADAVWRFTSPRAWAFALLGVDHMRVLLPHDTEFRNLQEELAGRLVALYRICAAGHWLWFENCVTYDNAKLPHALLTAARHSRRDDWREIALDSLRFLLGAQTAPEGNFRAIGCQGFWRRGGSPAQFDQQPLEAQSMISACLEADRATGDRVWLDHALRIYAWFHGANDIGRAIADPATGGCHDGLREDGVNANQGAESTWAYLQATVEMREALAARFPASRPHLRQRPEPPRHALSVLQHITAPLVASTLP